jgi:SprT protein
MCIITLSIEQTQTKEPKMSTPVSHTLKARVEAIIKNGIKVAEAHYGIKIKMPTISYNKKGTTAGTANYNTWHVELNPVLLNDHVEKFIARTPLHELAHLICKLVYPEAYVTSFVRTRTGSVKRSKREVHGPRWHSIMDVLGVESATRCHSYDTTNVVRKNVTKYEYNCGCATPHMVGGKVHTKIARGAKYTCKRCKTVLTAASKQVVIMPKLHAMLGIPTPAKQPVTKTTSGVGTKAERAKRLMVANPTLSRSGMVELFINQLGMTKAGASTYYYNLNK